MRLAALIATPLVLAGCIGPIEPTTGPTFSLVSAAGRSIGTVRAWETPGGVTFRVNAAGLPAGIHGIHVHAVGRCDAPGFTTAGPHWNPAARQHGFDNPAGPHRGDLPNVTVAATGVLQEAVTLPAASLAQLRDPDGSALVIHARADDLRTDPSGNSGDRIACATVSTL